MDRLAAPPPSTCPPCRLWGAPSGSWLPKSWWRCPGRNYLEVAWSRPCRWCHPWWRIPRRQRCRRCWSFLPRCSCRPWSSFHPSSMCRPLRCCRQRAIHRSSWWSHPSPLFPPSPWLRPRLARHRKPRRLPCLRPRSFRRCCTRGDLLPAGRTVKLKSSEASSNPPESWSHEESLLGAPKRLTESSTAPDPMCVSHVGPERLRRPWSPGWLGRTAGWPARQGRARRPPRHRGWRRSAPPDAGRSPKSPARGKGRGAIQPPQGERSACAEDSAFPSRRCFGAAAKAYTCPPRAWMTA